MIEPFSISEILSGGWKSYPFGPFRAGIEIAHLIAGEPAVALLRYEPGAKVPSHRHPGLETVYVLEGSQRDERGVYRAGEIVFNTEGTIHSVVSDDGCVVLIQWARPIEFLQDG